MHIKRLKPKWYAALTRFIYLFLALVYFSFVYFLPAKVFLQKKQYTTLCLVYHWRSRLNFRSTGLRYNVPRKAKGRNTFKEISHKKSKYTWLMTRPFVVRLYTSNLQSDTKHVLIDFLYHFTPLPADTDSSRSSDWKHSCMSKSNLSLSLSSIVMLFTNPDQAWNNTSEQ
jgi:hypothetical protein